MYVMGAVLFAVLFDLCSLTFSHTPVTSVLEAKEKKNKEVYLHPTVQRWSTVSMKIFRIECFYRSICETEGRINFNSRPQHVSIS
jgi:hypothetical protein